MLAGKKQRAKRNKELIVRLSVVCLLYFAAKSLTPMKDEQLQDWERWCRDHGGPFHLKSDECVCSDISMTAIILYTF
jgi:hypothetical protein